MDPLLRFLMDPREVWDWTQASDKLERLGAMMNRSLERFWSWEVVLPFILICFVSFVGFVCFLLKDLLGILCFVGVS